MRRYFHFSKIARAFFFAQTETIMESSARDESRDIIFITESK